MTENDWCYLIRDEYKERETGKGKSLNSRLTRKAEIEWRKTEIKKEKSR